MINASLPFGTKIASLVTVSSETLPKVPIRASVVVKTFGELLAELAVEPPPTFGMLKTTCKHLGLYLEIPGDTISFDLIAARKAGFRDFLKGRHYKENSIRGYTYHVQVLLRLAQKFGWDPDHSVSGEWKALLATAAAHGVLEITKHFSRAVGKPSDITIEMLDAWEDSKIRAGISYVSARSTRNRFIGSMQKQGWPNLKFPGMKANSSYGIPLEELDPNLGEEIKALLSWKQADFARNRPKKGQIREVSANKLQLLICGLAGYVINTLGKRPVSVKELIDQEFVESFVDWMINKRRVNGRSFKPSMGMILAVVKYHLFFKGLDFTWFKVLLDSIQIEADAERKDRKAIKLVDYEVLEAIPAKIGIERKAEERKRGREKRIACLAMEELVMRWLTILPWRQRNLRECRISGSKPNLFRGKIASFTGIDKPKWVLNEEATNPTAEFWQVKFSAKETKTGISVHVLLPRQLVAPLEEYLAVHRPNLMRKRSVDRLLINSIGNTCNSKLMQRVIGSWTLKYAGIRTTPHLFRDAVAFQWLKEHPEDYLTLSKMLWHKSIETTIAIYGSQYNESSAVRLAEEWRESRDAMLFRSSTAQSNGRPQVN